jgi:hypothetical protein
MVLHVCVVCVCVCVCGYMSDSVPSEADECACMYRGVVPHGHVLDGERNLAVRAGS